MKERFEIPFFAVLLLLAAALFLFIAIPYLNALALAVSLAILFHPLYRRFLRVPPRRKGIAAFAAVVIAIIVVFVPLMFFGYWIAREAQGLYGEFASGASIPSFTFLYERVNALSPGGHFDISQYAKQTLDVVLGNLGPAIGGIMSIGMTFFLAFFALYYLLKDGEALRQAIRRIIPLEGTRTDAIFEKLYLMANSVIRGSLVVAVVQGILVGTGFLMFGLSNPVLWGLVSIVAALIPVIGTAIIVIPAVAMLAIYGNIAGAVGLTIWGFVIVGLIDNFLRPLLIERRANAHPLLVLISVLGGLSVFGPMGFVLGPFTLSLFLALLEIYPSIILEKK